MPAPIMRPARLVESRKTTPRQPFAARPVAVEPSPLHEPLEHWFGVEIQNLFGVLLSGTSSSALSVFNQLATRAVASAT